MRTTSASIQLQSNSATCSLILWQRNWRGELCDEWNLPENCVRKQLVAIELRHSVWPGIARNLGINLLCKVRAWIGWNQVSVNHLQFAWGDFIVTSSSSRRGGGRIITLWCYRVKLSSAEDQTTDHFHRIYSKQLSPPSLSLSPTHVLLLWFPLHSTHRNEWKVLAMAKRATSQRNFSRNKNLSVGFIFPFFRFVLFVWFCGLVSDSFRSQQPMACDQKVCRIVCSTSVRMLTMRIFCVNLAIYIRN